jgi:uncharacterized membrane protein HdeD (DUF308 family)
MVVLSVILGVLLMIGGFACIFTPLATFLTTGYFICALMLVFGIVGIVRAFQKKADVFEIIVSVLAIIVGLIALFRPGSSLIFDGVILIFLACWFLVEGITCIVVGFKSKDTNSHWWVNLIVGILGIIVGIIAFANPMITAVTAGILLGIFFIQIGITLISMAFAAEEN